MNTNPRPQQSTATAQRLDDAIKRLRARLRAESGQDATGLTATQLGVLASVVREGPVTAARLAALERFSAQSVAQSPAVLKAAGPVHSEPAPQDGRNELMSADPSATELVDNLLAGRASSWRGPSTKSSPLLGVHSVNPVGEAAHGISTVGAGPLLLPMGAVSALLSRPLASRNLVRGPLIASAVTMLLGSVGIMLLTSRSPAIAIVLVSLIFGVTSASTTVGNQTARQADHARARRHRRPQDPLRLGLHHRPPPTADRPRHRHPGARRNQHQRRRSVHPHRRRRHDYRVYVLSGGIVGLQS